MSDVEDEDLSDLSMLSLSGVGSPRVIFGSASRSASSSAHEVTPESLPLILTTDQDDSCTQETDTDAIEVGFMYGV